MTSKKIKSNLIHDVSVVSQKKNKRKSKTFEETWNTALKLLIEEAGSAYHSLMYEENYYQSSNVTKIFKAYIENRGFGQGKTPLLAVKGVKKLKKTL